MRYVAPFAAGVLVVLLLLGLALTFRGRAIVREQLKLEQLTAARTGAQAIGNIADNVARNVESISQSSAVKSSSQSAVSNYLEAQAAHSPYTTSLFLYNRSGRVIAAANDTSEIARSLAGDLCFDKISAGDSETCFTNLYMTEDTSKRAYVLHPVYGSGGDVIRILAGGINIEDKDLQAIVMGINPGESGFSYLVDGAGRLVLSGDTDKAGTAFNVSNYEAVKQVVAGVMGSAVSEYGRRKMLATFYPVEPMGWGLVVQRPMSETGLVTGAMIKLMLVFIVLGAGGAAALAAYQSQTITRFLYILYSRMEGVAEGRRDQFIAANETCGLERLAHSFNYMVEMIEKTQARGSRELEDVRKTAQFNQGILSSIQDIFLVADSHMNVIMANEKAEQFIDNSRRPAIGRSLASLGDAWNQNKLREIAGEVVRTGQAKTVCKVRFKLPGGEGEEFFDFQIYPVQSDSSGILFYGREVSDMVERHERVASSEKFFRGVAAAAGDPVVMISENGGVEWMNPAAQSFLGAEDGHFAGNWFDYVEGESADAMKALLEAAKTPGDRAPMEEIDITAGGARLRIETTAGHVRGGDKNGFVLVFRSVPLSRLEDRESSEVRPKLENKLRFLTLVFEQAPEPLAVTGGDGKIVMANSAFADMFKERKELYQGRKLDHINAMPGALVDLAAASKQGSIEREVKVKAGNGRKFLAVARVVAVRGGAGGGYIVNFKDIDTERRLRKRENRVLEARTRTRMARTVSEKVEPTIDSIAESLKTLGTSIFADETRAIWSRAMAHCRELAHANISLGMYAYDNPVEFTTCRIDDIIRESTEHLRNGGFMPEGITLEPSLMGVSRGVQADPDQMKLILWHMMKNAVEAAAKNKSDPKVLVRAFESDMEGSRALIVEVMDNGPDFRPSEAERFFEPFYGTKEGGMGLGLTLARRAVLKHNGRIGISRSSGITRASFFIPLAESKVKTHAAR